MDGPLVYALSRLSLEECTNEPQMEPEKRERGGRRRRNKRGEKEGENQFSQTEAGRTNGGLKEEEEDTFSSDYLLEPQSFGLVHSHDVSLKSSKHTR